MSFQNDEIAKVSQGFARVVRGKRARQERMNTDVAEFFFEQCRSGAYKDDEGTLRASFEKGNPDRIEEVQGDTLILGTSVYYAVMVEEGHVIGVRDKRHNHRGKRSGKVKGTYSINKGFVPGLFFMQQAMDALDKELFKAAEAVFEDIGKAVGFD